MSRHEKVYYPPLLVKLLSAVFAALCVLLLGVQDARALYITSDTYQIERDDEGSGYSIPRNVECSKGDTFTVDIRAEGASGTVTWNLKYNDVNLTTPSSSVRLSDSSGSTTNIEGTLNSVVCHVVVTARDNSGASSVLSFNIGLSRNEDEVDELSFTPDMNRISQVNTSAVAANIRKAYGASIPDSIEIYSLFDTEEAAMSSEAYMLKAHEANLIADLEMQVMFVLPKVAVNGPGIYIARVNLSNLGTRYISIQTGSGYNYELADAALYDGEGNALQITEINDEIYFAVPENGYCIAALMLDDDVDTEDEYYAYLTRYIGGTEAPEPVPPISDDTLPEVNIGLIDSLTTEERETIAEILSEELSTDITPSQIRTLTQDNLMPAREPTQAMKDHAASENYELIYKLENTLTIPESGYYVFSIDVPPELVGQPAKDYKLFIMSYDDVSGAIKTSQSLPGALWTWTDAKLARIFDNMTLPEQIIVSGFFPAASSICVGVVKAVIRAVLALLSGCSVLPAASVWAVSIAGIFILLRHHRK